jgi:cell wall-associated NlpC family hydrolase
VKWLGVKTPQKFDAILIRLKGQPMHCGVYLDNDLFIHCLKGSNVTIESINSAMWKNRILGYYRYEK